MGSDQKEPEVFRLRITDNENSPIKKLQIVEGLMNIKEEELNSFDLRENLNTTALEEELTD